ncbi:MAG: hypothetical protein ACKVW3_09990 [Phycisphaerales bacterium]
MRRWLRSVTAGGLTTGGLAACILTALAATVLAPGGCGRSMQIVERSPYPRDVPAGPTLDIQVVRDGTEIELTNTTARGFGRSVIWLNRRHGLEIDGLRVGERKRLALREFLDEYSEPFRAGGFFATEATERLVLAELQTEAEPGTWRMLGLVVVGERDR